MNIGFIGLGIMGKPMAKNLLRAGHPLFVYNRSTQSVQELAAAGAAASSIAQICAQCSVIFTMLPDSPDVRSVVLEQLYPHLKGGQVLIDMSSIDPGVSREIGEKLAEKQVGMLDAPVSGGEPKAVDATLSFMVGGQDALFRQYAPLLKTMGRTVTYCGPLGAGNTVKLANQMIVAANIAAAAEGLMLARRNGVSPETVFHARPRRTGRFCRYGGEGSDDASQRHAARLPDQAAYQGSEKRASSRCGQRLARSAVLRCNAAAACRAGSGLFRGRPQRDCEIL